MPPQNLHVLSFRVITEKYLSEYIINLNMNEIIENFVQLLRTSIQLLDYYIIACAVVLMGKHSKV